MEWRLTLPSSGRAPAGLARCVPPLMSNVRPAKMQLRSITNVLACILLLACGVAAFLLLLPIPQTLSVDMPKGLNCEYFIAGRRGWGCARLGSFYGQPFLAVPIIAVGLFCASWLRHSVGAPIRITLSLTWGIFVGLSGVIGLIYVAQGHARPSYGLLSILSISVAGCGFLLVHRLHRGKLENHPVDPERKKQLQDGIEIEIAERNEESRSAKRAERQA